MPTPSSHVDAIPPHPFSDIELDHFNNEESQFVTPIQNLNYPTGPTNLNFRQVSAPTYFRNPTSVPTQFEVYTSDDRGFTPNATENDLALPRFVTEIPPPQNVTLNTSLSEGLQLIYERQIGENKY